MSEKVQSTERKNGPASTITKDLVETAKWSIVDSVKKENLVSLNDIAKGNNSF